MSTEDRFEFDLENGWKSVSAVKELDAYISREENKYGLIIVRDEIVGRCEPRIARSLMELKIAMKKDKIEKKEAYEYLKKSNRTMKTIIEKLQEEMKICRENIRSEFTNFENLNTERLLSIDPRRFVTSTPLGK